MPSSVETNASKDYDDANDYINSMSQINTTTIKSHSIQDYAQGPMQIRSHEPMMPTAEQPIIPLIIDVSNDELNIIVSPHNDSKPALSESSNYKQRLNSFIDETTISRDGSNISNISIATEYDFGHISIV